MKAQRQREARLRRHRRVRKKISGTADCPRLVVFRSARHIYAQVVDDVGAVTLASASSLEKEIASPKPGGGKVASAEKVGEAIAKRAAEKGVKSVVFDRGGYKYHGRVAALADSARGAGLEF